MSDIVREITGYPTSTDYEALWELAQRQSVVCLVGYRMDYNPHLLDVAQTIAVPDDSGNKFAVDIACRGISYVQGFGKKDFIEQCQKAKVQWLVPQDATPCD